MTTFNDRERAFESKFAHDAEMQFRVQARRNRLVGDWAAGVLGLTGVDARAYADAIVRIAVNGGDADDVAGRLSNDLSGHDAVAQISQKMHACLADAKAQLADQA